MIEANDADFNEIVWGLLWSLKTHALDIKQNTITLNQIQDEATKLKVDIELLQHNN